jgi:chitinase
VRPEVVNVPHRPRPSGFWLVTCAIALGCSSAPARDPGVDTESGSGGSGGGTASGGRSGSGGNTGSGGRGGMSSAGKPDAGTGGSPADAAPESAPADVPLPECKYPEWNRTTDYKTGDVVMYMGKAYVATHDNKSLDPTISTFYWSPYNGCVPPPPPPAAQCPALDKLLPEGEKTFMGMFTPPFMGWVPLKAYSYSSLCKALAVARLQGFAASGNATQDKRELAAFFANVAVETAYLTAIDERGHQAADGSYHGRGSLQITGQPIYAEAGAALGLNLAGMPQLGSQEGVVWQTGIWYWMLHANPSVPAPNVCHGAIAAGDFGKTLRIIKGDCASLDSRATQYRKNCSMLGVDPGKTTCP